MERPQASQVNLRELACVTKYGGHTWEQKTLLCVHCKTEHPDGWRKALLDCYFAPSPLLKWLDKRHAK